MTILNFTISEQNIICFFHDKEKLKAINNLKKFLIETDDEEIKNILISSIDKLKKMNDREYEAIEFIEITD